MKTSLTIIGSCVLNQAIRYGARYGNSPYLVKGVTWGLHPFVLGQSDANVGAAPGICGLLDLMQCETDMAKKSTMLDFTRDLKKFCRGEYLAVDLALLNKAIIELLQDGAIYYLSEAPTFFKPRYKGLEQENKNLLYSFANKQGYGVNYVSNPVLEYSEARQKEMLSNFAEKLLKIYDPEHILLAECPYAYTCINPDRTLDLNKFNKEYWKCFDESTQKFEKIFAVSLGLSKSHVIRGLPNMLSDDDESVHDALRASPRHYPELYYEYELKAMQTITDGLPDDETEHCLDDLFEEYTDKMDQLKETCIAKTCAMLKSVKEFDSYDVDRCEYVNKKPEATFLEAVQERYSLKRGSTPAYGYGDVNEYLKNLMGETVRKLAR